MRTTTATLFLWLAFTTLCRPAMAQTPGRLGAAEDLYTKGQYAAALTAVDEVLHTDRSSAPAYYLRARILRTREMNEPGDAKDAIDAALKLDPDNPAYLEVKLLLWREDIGLKLYPPPLRKERRRGLAKKILRLDSTSAVARTELGILRLYDYFSYHDRHLVHHQFTLPTHDGLAPLTGPPTYRPSMQDRAFSDSRFDLQKLVDEGLSSREGMPATEDRQEAETFFTRALTDHPDHGEAYRMEAMLLAAEQEWGALLTLAQSMQVHLPDAAASFNYAGLALQRLDRGSEAAAAFAQALERMRPQDRAEMEDLRRILSPDDVKAYEADSAGFSEAFWRQADPWLSTPVNERRTEHYARMTYADLLFGHVTRRRRGWDSDRGETYVRWGPPTRQAFLVANRPIYSPSAASRLDAAYGAETSAAVETTLPLSSSGGRTDRYEVWEYDDARFVFGEYTHSSDYVNGWLDLYSPPAIAFNHPVTARSAANDDYLSAMKRRRKEVPQAFEFDGPGTTTPLTAYTSAFKGTDTAADLYVTYGIPLVPGSGEAVPDLKSGVFLLDETGQEVFRNVAHARSEDGRMHIFPDLALWTETRHVEAASASYDVAVEYEAPGQRRSGRQREHVDVPAFSSNDVAVSDLVLAYAAEETEPGATPAPGTLIRMGTEITPAPWRLFTAGQPVYLYFEAYNLDAASDGRVEGTVEATLIPQPGTHALRRLVRLAFGRRRDEGVSATFPLQGSGPDVGQYFVLDTAGLAPGDYVVVLRVTDSRRGQKAETARTLTLR